MEYYRKGEKYGIEAVNDPNYSKIISDHSHHNREDSNITYWSSLITRPFLRAKLGFFKANYKFNTLICINYF